jgi:putative restriction endonuclease
LEAAHIWPYRGLSDNHVANGLLLRADLHTLFDVDLLGFEPSNLKAHFHPKVLEFGYAEFEGRELELSAEVKLDSFSLGHRWQSFQNQLSPI